MSVLRNLNVLDQMRIDVPHFRLLESAARGDFDAVVGRMLGGGQALVVKGLSIAGSVGSRAEALELVVDGAIVINANASESGSFLSIPDGTANEVLNGATNGKVSGAFVSGATNYVGLDFVREEDSTTSDLVTFKNPLTGELTQELTNIGEVLTYRIVVGSTPFSAQSNVVPIAKIAVSAGGTVSSIVDARPTLFRLASGGDLPTSTWSYPWPQNRSEASDTFIGADKAISSQKDWNDAIMTRLWELGGGINWYSNTADRNVWSINTESPFTNGDYWTFNSGTGATEWKAIRFFFTDSGSGVYYNDIAGITGSPVTVADGQCVYVDLDRTSNATLTAHVTSIQTVGTGTIPGSRWILAWRNGSSLYTRNWRYPVGTVFTPATNLAQGVVRLNQAVPVPADPVVVAIGTNGAITVAATGGNASAATFTGFGQGSGVVGVSGSTWSPSGSTSGVRGTGIAEIEANGVFGTGSASSTASLAGPGVKGLGGAATGAGAAGPGGRFQGGNSSTVSVAAGVGVESVGGGGSDVGASGGDFTGGTATLGDGVGVVGRGGAGAYGAYGGEFTGSGGSAGARGVGGPTNGVGLEGLGTATGTGVTGEGGTSGGIGGDFVGGDNAGANGGVGVRGTGGAGATNGGTGVAGLGGGTNGAGVSGTGGSSTAYGLISTLGHVGCPNTNEFKYTGTRTGVLILSGADFSLFGPFNSGSSGALTANGLKPVNGDGSMNTPHWQQGTVGVTETLAAKIPLPRGATITGVELWMENNTGLAIGPGGSVALKHHTYGAGTPSTSVILNTSIAVIPNTTNGWIATSASPSASAMETGRTGAGNSGWMTAYIQLPSTGSSVIRFGGLRVTYTYTEVDFTV